MKIFTSLATLLLLILSCKTTSSFQNQNAEVVLSQNDQLILNTAIQLQQVLGDKVWPRIAQFKATVVFLTDEGQFLFKAKTPPPLEYKPISSQNLFWSKQDYKTDTWYNADGSKLSQQEYDQGYFANAYSTAETNGHFLNSVFFVDSIQRFRKKGTNWSPDDWLSIFWHEQFHNFQDNLYNPKLVTRDVSDFSNIRDYVESETFLSKIRDEQKLVVQALASKEISKKRNIMCDSFIKLRTDRYQTMKLAAVKSEAFYELSEGTARYFEELMSVEAGKFFFKKNERENFKISNFGYFENYSKRDVSSYYNSLGKVSPTMRYFYSTGFGLALFFDQIDLEWKDSIFKTEGFMFSTLKKWCKTGDRKSSN